MPGVGRRLTIPKHPVEANCIAAVMMPTSAQPTPALFLLSRDAGQVDYLCSSLKSMPWPVLSFDSASALLGMLGTGCVIVVENDGLDLLLLIDRLRRRRDMVRTILLTNRPSVAQATAAIRAGIDDLLELPVGGHKLRQHVLAQMAHVVSRNPV